MVVVIVMGVCGSGKTSVGQALAEKIGCPFVDADDYHPAANVEKMRRGTPLTDEDRQPWLQSLNSVLKKWEEERLCRSSIDELTNDIDSRNPSCRSTPAYSPAEAATRESLPMGLHQVITGVLACSALRQIYRTTLLKGQASSVSSGSKLQCVIVFLQGSEETILARLQGRRDHYMPASLLRSQLDTLEAPTEDETDGLIPIEDLTESMNDIVSKVIQCLLLIIKVKYIHIYSK